jgi:hypothetical protein
MYRRIMNLVTKACEQNLEIEKIIVTEDELRQLGHELQQPLVGFKNNFICGVKLEVE